MFGIAPRQIKKMGISMRRNLFLDTWGNCSLTIAATRSVDSNLIRSAENSPSDVRQLPGKGNSPQSKLSRTPRAEDKIPPREVSRRWLNFVI
jgi:hypothetical protein